MGGCYVIARPKPSPNMAGFYLYLSQEAGRTADGWNGDRQNHPYRTYREALIGAEAIRHRLRYRLFVCVRILPA